VTGLALPDREPKLFELRPVQERALTMIKDSLVRESAGRSWVCRLAGKQSSPRM
jgi:hypothetical protein